jgi:uncharacterized membrane protein
MAFEETETITIAAPPEAVWGVYTDVERWPEWTPAMRKIERLDDGPLALGSTARIEADRSPTSVWTVTEYTEGRSFTWETSTMGVKIVGWHSVEPDGAGSRASMGVRMSGLMSTLLRPMLRSVARRNLPLEAAGLKSQCEGARP